MWFCEIVSLFVILLFMHTIHLQKQDKALLQEKQADASFWELDPRKNKVIFPYPTGPFFKSLVHEYLKHLVTQKWDEYSLWKYLKIKFSL
jgi:hypothetical protein